MNYYHRFVANVPLRRWTVLIFLCGILFSASQYDDYYFINLYFYLFDLQTGPANTQESECVNQTSFNRVVLDRCRFGLVYLVITKYATDFF